MTRKKDSDPSVFAEPHLRDGGFERDPSEARVAAAERRRRARTAREREDEALDHGVWDEPARSPELSGPPPAGALRYGDWLARRAAETPARRTWLVTLALALTAGPWAVFGALFEGVAGGASAAGVLALVAIGPLTEEIMKVAGALWAVERRPYLFATGGQIVLAAFAGGLAFAIIENLLYLNVYVPNPSDFLVVWRWTVCVALHTGCSTVAGVGLARVWRDAWARRGRPRLAVGARLLVTAVVVHGAYNGLALLLEATKLPF